MDINSARTAAGQMAGYLFQPERALYHLATSPGGALVGIETLDDIAVLLPGGKVLREQAKHSIEESNPLYENKVGLWKTFDIWLSALAAQELDLSKTALQLVTNTSVTRGFANQMIIRNRTPEDVSYLASLLRKSAKKVPKSVRPFASNVLTRSDVELESIIRITHVIDKKNGASGGDLKAHLTTMLPMPNGKQTEILQSLLGWIHDTAIELIREKKPAWLSREAFVERFIALVTAFHDKRFLAETAEALISVSNSDRSAHRHRMFVKQLLWLGLSENDEQLIEAIDDFIRSSSERIRLAQKGVATLSDFREFETRLVGRWRNHFKAIVAELTDATEESRQSCGKRILHKILDHREPLAKYETQEWYLTRGAYHRLADRPASMPKVGWHPLYKTKCNQ